MHTAEHLIGGAVVRMLGCARAFTTHIERKKSKCDFRCERGLTPDELERIERTVNEQIASGADVRAEIVPVDEARKRYDLSRLPEGATEVRIVHIGSFDIPTELYPRVFTFRVSLSLMLLRLSVAFIHGRLFGSL